MTNILSLLACIGLLIYSFSGFNAKRSREAIFITSVILYIIVILFGIFASTIDFKNPVGMLTVITLIIIMFNMVEMKKQ